MQMALRGLLMTMMVAAAAVPPASGVDHIVGDNKGWNTGVGYAAWADPRFFHVGDSITFMYTRQVHNVIEVNASEFERCTYSSETDITLTSGFDVVPLTTVGKQWYISGMFDDCFNGMKLALTVSPADGPAPSPVSGSSASPPSSSVAGEVSPAMIYCLWVLAVVWLHMS